MDKGCVSPELLNAVSELISHCKHNGWSISPALLSDMPKGPSWLRVVSKLHFSGVNITGFTKNDLGLDGDGEICDEHRVYFEIIEKLQSLSDIRNKDSYEEFMNWLVELNFVTDKTNESVIANVPGWQKSMQPELYHLATSDDTLRREGFDPNWFKDELELYKKRHSFMKQQILESFIAEAPRSFVIDLFKKWLSDEEVCKWLFTQHYYPLNMLMHEYCEWNLLLHGLPKIPSEIKSNIAASFNQCTGINAVVDDSSEDLALATPKTTAFGRVLLTKGAENKYLKVQSQTETDRDFRRGYERLNLLHKLKHDLDHESFVPNPIKLRRVCSSHDLLEATGASFNDKEIFKQKVKKGSCLAMEFTTPNDISYEEYVYDVKNDTSAMDALHIYAKDYGRLWKNGLLPPPCLSAFHDVDCDRKHGMLAPFLNLKCEGSIERWNGLATDFPNIGGEKMGMRDKVDILLPSEKSQNYFSKQIINPECLEDRNKIRLEELAKAAQGLCLQYARRFNHRFNHKSPENIEAIKKDIGSLLLDLFTHALPLSRDECKTLMEGHDLLNQCCREMSYWLAKDVPYVSDLRKAEINRLVYPHLPIGMQGCVLPKKQLDFLTTSGFYDDKRDLPGECQLGSGSGRMPLIALNALVVKILAFGVIKNNEMEQLAMTEDAKTVVKQEFVA